MVGSVYKYSEAWLVWIFMDGTGWNGLKSEPAIFEKLIGNCELCSRKHLAV